MNKPLLASHLLSSVAEDRRRVVGLWRIWIYCRRICIAKGLPLVDLVYANLVVKELEKKKEVTPFPGIKTVFVASSPFASILPVIDELVVQEANPYAVISHRLAMTRHGLTNWVPNELYYTDYHTSVSSKIPLGTTPDDWADIKSPPGQLPAWVGNTAVHWTRAEARYDFGHEIGWCEGIAVYQTDRERTLLDGLRTPNKCGGILEVLEAWQNSSEQIKLERMIEYVEKFDSAVMRQRVGLLLETFELTHPQLADWQGRLQRGGSLKLVSGEPYAPTYSNRWNLSINLPRSVISRFGFEVSENE